MNEIETPPLAKPVLLTKIFNRITSSDQISHFINYHPYVINYILPKKTSKIGKYLGEGLFGSAYEYENDKVIKIEFLSARKSAKIDKFFSLLGFFKDNDIKHVAKVYDYGIIPMKKHIHKQAVCIYVIMEKVRPLTAREKDVYRTYYNRLMNKDEIKISAKFCPASLVALKDFLFFLYNSYDDFGHLDAHGNNVGFSDDGTIKLIDHSGFLKGKGLGAEDEEDYDGDLDIIDWEKQKNDRSEDYEEGKKE